MAVGLNTYNKAKTIRDKERTYNDVNTAKVINNYKSISSKILNELHDAVMEIKNHKKENSQGQNENNNTDSDVQTKRHTTMRTMET